MHSGTLRPVRESIVPPAAPANLPLLLPSSTHVRMQSCTIRSQKGQVRRTQYWHVSKSSNDCQSWQLRYHQEAYGKFHSCEPTLNPKASRKRTKTAGFCSSERLRKLSTRTEASWAASEPALHCDRGWRGSVSMSVSLKRQAAVVTR